MLPKFSGPRSYFNFEEMKDVDLGSNNLFLSFVPCEWDENANRHQLFNELFIIPFILCAWSYILFFRK